MYMCAIGSMNFEGVDFKRAIAKTPIIIEQAAMQINEQYARPTFLPVRQYIEFLIQQTLIDPELGHGYIEGYEIARFSTAPVSQEKYYDTMKHLAAILHHMGYRLHAVQPKQPNNSSSSAKDGDGDVIPSASSPGVTTAQRQWSDTNQQGRREPRDDDVASLAQSVATWTSRSTQSRHIRSRRSRLRSEQPEDDDEVSYDDECYEDYKQHLQQVIYSRLMWNPSPKYK
ncbi:hypothetical protein BX666DRAFT_1989573 [Dichotomocladium elegans]|nr:hypothetical protein BX666DRAFT_1989573 [Dichotomocladium elegans]